MTTYEKAKNLLTRFSIPKAKHWRAIFGKIDELTDLVGEGGGGGNAETSVVRIKKKITLGDVSANTVHEIIPAPGDNKIISVNKVKIIVDVTSPYNEQVVANMPEISYDGGTQIGAGPFMSDQTTKVSKTISMGGSNSIESPSPETAVINKSVQAVFTREITGGTCIVEVDISYEIFSFSDLP